MMKHLPSSRYTHPPEASRLSPTSSESSESSSNKNEKRNNKKPPQSHKKAVWEDGSSATGKDGPVVLPFVGGFPLARHSIITTNKKSQSSSSASNHKRGRKKSSSSSSAASSSDESDTIHSASVTSKGHPTTLFLDIKIPNSPSTPRAKGTRRGGKKSSVASVQSSTGYSSNACITDAGTAGTAESTFAQHTFGQGGTTITSNDLDVQQNCPIASMKNARVYGTVKRSNLEELYDLVVIGGGPAGVAGAIRSAQMGRRTIVVDRPKAQAPPRESGIDIFFGAPTGLYSKALRDASKTISVKALRAQGLDDDVIWKQITNNILKLAERNAEGMVSILSKLGVDYQQGEARLLPESDLRAIEAAQEHCAADPSEYSFNHMSSSSHDKEALSCRSVVVRQAPIIEILEDGNEGVQENASAIVSGTHILVATGSKAFHVPGIPFDGHRIFDSDSINSLSFLPRSVVIMGAGIIAIEFCQMFRKLTCEVTMLIRGDLKSSAGKLGLDPDVTDKLIELLIKSGVKIIEGATVKEFATIPADQNEPLTFTLNEREEPLKTDIFLAALGREGNGDDPVLGLEENEISVSRKGHVDSLDQATLKTNSRQIYAAGDVAGSSLASAAKSQAVNAVEAMFGAKTFTPEDNFGDDVTRGVWTLPEIGYYGSTKKSAEAKGINVVEGISYYQDCLRGRLFAPDGLLKIVVNADTGVVLGIHMIGEDAAEMVHYGMGLVQNKTKIEDIMATTYTAVTYHELFKEAALDANFKLDFGVEWQNVFKAILDTCELDPKTGKPLNNVSDEELREAFDKANSRPGSVGLDIEDMRHLFTKIGRPINKRVVVNLFRLSDLDHDGVVDWDEFRTIWNKIHS